MEKIEPSRAAFDYVIENYPAPKTDAEAAELYYLARAHELMLWFKANRLAE